MFLAWRTGLGGSGHVVGVTLGCPSSGRLRVQDARPRWRSSHTQTVARGAAPFRGVPCTTGSRGNV